MVPSIRAYVGREETEKGVQFIVAILGIHENALISPKKFRTPTIKDFLRVIRNEAQLMGVALYRVHVETLFDSNFLTEDEKDLLAKDFDIAVKDLDAPVIL